MKQKFVLSLCLFMSFTIATRAQVKAGLKFGTNFSWFTNSIDPFARGSAYYEDYIGFEKFFRASVNGGIVVTLNPNAPLSVSAELLHSAKGNKHRIKNPDVVIVDDYDNESPAYDTYTYAVDYIEMPLLFQPNFNLSRNGYWGVYAGVAPAYAVNRKRAYRYYDQTGYLESRDQEKLKKELQDVRKFNFFPLAGVKFGGDRAFLDLRFDYSLLPVFSKSTNTDGSNLSTHLCTVSISAGVYL